MMNESRDLDLYGSAGWRESFGLRAFGWKGIAALGTSLAIVAGAGAYGWMTNTTAVTVDRALEEFRQSASQLPAAKSKPKRKERSTERSAKAQKPGSKPAREGGTKQRSAPKVAAAAPSDNAPSEQQNASQTEAASTQKPGSQYERSGPREGVYTWATDGWESAGGARRNFPDETQRIIRTEQGGWLQHHYFSDQRENWTRFRRIDEGAAFVMQRNKVTFGPITEDSTIDFTPPMLVGPRELKVGQKWEGRWSGKTSGTYRGETFERVTLDIGGEQVVAFGIHVYTEMHGEIEGEVEARVWLSPEHAITVREHYKQRIKADVGDYRAEWTMTLKSLRPQT